MTDAEETVTPEEAQSGTQPGADVGCKEAGADVGCKEAGTVHGRAEKVRQGGRVIQAGAEFRCAEGHRVARVIRNVTGDLIAPEDIEPDYPPVPGTVIPVCPCGSSRLKLVYPGGPGTW